MKNKTIVMLLTVLSITQIPNIQSAAMQEIEHKQLNEKDLLSAARNGHINLLNHCLRQLVNVNTADKHGNTALMIAVRDGREEIVRMLLEGPLSRVNVNAANKYGYTTLMLAASEGHEEIADMLLKDPRINVNQGKRKVEIQ